MYQILIIKNCNKKKFTCTFICQHLFQNQNQIQVLKGNLKYLIVNSNL